MIVCAASPLNISEQNLWGCTIDMHEGTLESRACVNGGSNMTHCTGFSGAMEKPQVG